MKSKGTKRFISFLLVFVMMVSSLTLNLQAEEITYINLPDAVNTEPVDTDISNIEEEPPDSDEEIPSSESVEENQGEPLDKDDSNQEISSEETAKDDRSSEEETDNGEINQETYELSVLLDETLGTVEIEFLENNIDGSSKWQVYSNITFPYEFASYVSEDFEEFTENPLELDIYDDTVLIVNYTEINIGLFSLTSEFYQELEEKYNSSYFSPEDALVIKTAEDFFDFAKFSNNGNNFEKRYVILSEDIDLESRSWTSIKQFSGVFDGNGKKIENLLIEGANNGIFSTNNGTVKNFLVASGTIDSTASIIGTMATNNKGLILNCGNKADIIKGQTAGGISGKLTGSIAYCFNSGNIINGNSLGGIIGATVKGSVVYSCYNTGEISGQVAGGIAGMATTNFKVSNSFK